MVAFFMNTNQEKTNKNSEKLIDEAARKIAEILVLVVESKLKDIKNKEHGKNNRR